MQTRYSIDSAATLSSANLTVTTFHKSAKVLFFAGISFNGNSNYLFTSQVIWNLSSQITIFIDSGQTLLSELDLDCKRELVLTSLLQLRKRKQQKSTLVQCCGDIKALPYVRVYQLLFSYTSLDYFTPCLKRTRGGPFYTQYHQVNLARYNSIEHFRNSLRFYRKLRGACQDKNCNCHCVIVIAIVYTPNIRMSSYRKPRQQACHLKYLFVYRN